MRGRGACHRNTAACKCIVTTETLLSRLRGRGRGWGLSARGGEDGDGSPCTVHLDDLAGADRSRAVTRGEHRGDAELTRGNRRVREDAAIICDQRADSAEEHRPGGARL